MTTEYWHTHLPPARQFSFRCLLGRVLLSESMEMISLIAVVDSNPGQGTLQSRSQCSLAVKLWSAGLRSAMAHQTHGVVKVAW